MKNPDNLRSTKESLAHEFAFLFSLLNFPYLVLFFFFLVEELKEPKLLPF